MRIGMVTACYKPVINGVTRMISLMKRELETAGHEVTIFAWGEPDPAGDEPGVVRSPALPLGDSGYHFNFRYNRVAQARLQEMEIIHCHHLFMSVEMAHRYGRCPIVYTNHTRYDLYTGAYTPLAQPAADAIMRQIWPEFTDFCDVVVTPSESVRQVMLEFGVRRPIEVIANGVDLRLYRQPCAPFSKADLAIPPDAILLAYVGRLSPEKNVAGLLAQFAIAREIVPHLHLLLVGKGPLLDSLRRQAADLDIAAHCHFTGGIPFEDVARYLQAADLFVTASASEVHPLTVLEAMAAGLPVIGVDAPGLADIVASGKTGQLISSADGGLAAAIVALALQPALRCQMSHAARQESERYDIGHTVTQTLALYRRLLATRPDLQRKRGHGRWRRRRQWVQPLVEQLARAIRLPEGNGERRE